jgi:hypothetical protein
MQSIRLSPWALAAGLAGLLAGTVALAAGRGLDYPFERSGGSQDDPALVNRDLTGRSVKCPRVRAVHSRDAAQAGASAYFLFADPWAGYARGRELFLREFAAEDGVFGESGRAAGPVLDDGVTRQASRDHVSACGLCHNSPWRDAGAGITIAKNGGTGRNTPHLFGAGLVEMLGWQLRLDLLALGDRNRDGFIGVDESRGVRAVVFNLPPGAPGRQAVDFGRFGDLDGDGQPDLNGTLHVIYVDRDGKRIPWARSLKVPGVAGYTFEVQVFGFGQRGRLPVSSTLRGFAAQAFDTHAGLQAHDPTLSEEPREDGLARVSLAGAPQFISAVPRDRGNVLGPGGVSLDDPDRDGCVEEISEGDQDLLEWYQLNHPSPARGPLTPKVVSGERLFTRIGCAGCHTPDWRLPAANPGAADYTQRALGDRRFFNLEVKPGPDGELRGRLHLLAERRDGRLRRKLGAVTVRGIFSDFRYHDLGPQCYQMQFDGSTLTQFRTTPLWGVGSTAPYGHDGSALTLEQVIRRHGGEAARVTRAYRRLPEGDRDALLRFLESLVLYSTSDVPTDINRDGKIDRHFRVAGQDTGRETFNPEWLFNTPCRIEGPVVAPDGRRILSRAVTNLKAAYGADLPWMRDLDGDGFPDILGFSPPVRAARAAAPQHRVGEGEGASPPAP